MIIINENKKDLRFHIIHSFKMILKNDKLDALEKYCLKEPEIHAFTLWDLRYERDNTDFYIYWDGRIRGYMLIYYAVSIPSVIVYGEKGVMAKLLEIFDLEKAIIHMPYKFRHMWKGDNRMYKILVMSREPEKFKVSEEIVKIEDAEKLSLLFQDPRYLVTKAKTWGIIKDGYAISSISALATLPEAWVLGALITKKEYRKRGYAKRLIEYFLNEAYGKTIKVVLWVRSGNYPAIELYKKYNFKIISEDVWINVGVDILP